jgi:uncharacterized protein YqgC (DUF456 family)
METMTVILFILSGISIIFGIIGLISPVLPGQLLILIGLFLAAWAEDFIHVGYIPIMILVLLTILAYVIDFLAGALGAKRFGASRSAAIGAVLGAIVGIFFGFVGVIIGPFIGAFIGQILSKNDLAAAGRAGFGAWLGFLIGTAAKIALGFSMIGIFVIARFF